MASKSFPYTEVTKVGLINPCVFAVYAFGFVAIDSNVHDRHAMFWCMQSSLHTYILIEVPAQAGLRVNSSRHLCECFLCLAVTIVWELPSQCYCSQQNLVLRVLLVTPVIHACINREVLKEAMKLKLWSSDTARKIGNKTYVTRIFWVRVAHDIRQGRIIIHWILTLVDLYFSCNYHNYFVRWEHP